MDVCVVPLHVHFRWGVALVGEFNYWALLTPSWDPPFRYREYSGRRRSSEAGIMKGSDFGLDSCFVYILELTSFNICFVLKVM